MKIKEGEPAGPIKSMGNFSVRNGEGFAMDRSRLESMASG